MSLLSLFEYATLYNKLYRHVDIRLSYSDLRFELCAILAGIETFSDSLSVLLKSRLLKSQPWVQSPICWQQCCPNGDTVWHPQEIQSDIPKTKEAILAHLLQFAVPHHGYHGFSWFTHPRMLILITGMLIKELFPEHNPLLSRKWDCSFSITYTFISSFYLLWQHLSVFHLCDISPKTLKISIFTFLDLWFFPPLLNLFDHSVQFT